MLTTLKVDTKDWKAGGQGTSEISTMLVATCRNEISA
jgi:hypothetical protein